MALLKFKRSATPSKVPTTSDLSLGELAMNTYDGKLYMKKDDGTQAIVEIGAASGGGTWGSITGTLSNQTDLWNALSAKQDSATALTTTTSFGGDVSGTYNNIIVADDSHNHIIANVDGLQAALDGKADLTGDTFTGLVGFAGGSYVAGNGDFVARRSNGSTGVYYFVDANDKYLYWDGAGYYFGGSYNVNSYGFAATGYVQAPIFYDSNNTAYYLDPNSTSVLNELSVVGNISVGNTAGEAQNAFRIDGYNNDLAIIGSSGAGATAGTSISFRTAPAGGGELTRAAIDSGGNLSMYGGSLFINSGGYIQTNAGGVKWDQSGVRSWSMFPTSGSIVLESGDGGGAFYVNPSGGVRAPIFYDSANTAYYVDPANTGTSLVVAGGAYAAGQVRATGWWGSASGSATALGVEIGQSGGRGYVLSYNRDTAAYGPVSFEATDFTFTGVSGGYAQIDTSFRAPIFYDSGNTAYYVDPASTSVLNGLYLLNSAPTLVLKDSDSTGAAQIGYISFHDNGGVERAYVGYGSGGNTDFYIRNTQGINNLFATYTLATGSVRSPIFYDSDNTAYYFNGAGVSQGFGFAIRGDQGSTATTNQLFLWDAGNTTTSAIGFKANGGAFTNPTGNGDGYNTYFTMDTDGRGWVFRRGTGGTDFTAAYTSGWILNNGIWQAQASMRAPIFYDSANTAFFVDPAGGSRLSTTYTDQYYAYGWFRNIYSGQGVYNEATVQHFYSDEASGWNIAGNGVNSWLRFRDSYGGTIRGYVHATTNNDIGFLNQDGSWRARVVGGDYFLVDGSSARAPIFYDSGNTGFYLDPNSVTNINRITASGRSLVGSATIDMSGLDQNTYYPVTIPINTARRTTMRIENALNSNAPSWSAHPSGFSLYIEWVSNGNGWGTIPTDRDIKNWREAWTNVTIVGGFTHMTHSSQEVIWLRGGGTYYFSADNDVTPTIRTTTYESLGQTVEPRSTVFNNPYDAATGRAAFGELNTTSRMTAAVDMRAPIFYDSNDTSYVLDPNGTSVLNAINVWGEIGPRRNDVQSLLRSYNTSAGSPLQFFLDHNYGNVDIGNNRGAIFGYGTYWQFANSARAPIFYDSNDTGYYVDPNSTSQIVKLRVISAGNSAGGNIKLGPTGEGSAKWSYITGAHYNDTSESEGIAMIGTYAASGANSVVIGGSIYEANPATEIQFWTHNATTHNLGGTQRLNIGSGGNVIAYVDVRAPVFYDSNNTGYYADLSVTGDSIRAAGDIVAFYSDDRLKDRGDNIANALDKVQSLNGFHYTANETAQKFGYKANPQVGVSAQEVEAVLPEVVKDAAIGHGYKTVDYAKLVPLLIEAIKELKAEVETLKKG